ncbi:hypothetical protein KEM56_004468 [Ascosphaera pollenicola]|nr:hypothetical protein KEM56_004468 [Ascosphaera pollenicola]
MNLKVRRKNIWLIASFAGLGACLYGYDGVYFTGVSAMETFCEHFGNQLPDGTWGIKSSDLSVMTSMINVGELVGSLAASFLNDRFGRKGVFFVGSIAVIIGIVLQIVATHGHGLIIGGRIILGFGVGNFSATGPLYIGEIAPTDLRGPLLMCWQFTLSISQIIAAALNRGTQEIKSSETNNGSAAYRIPIGVQLIFPLLVLTTMWFVPESPRWLVRRGKHEKARAALTQINKGDETYDVDREFNEMKQSVEEESLLSENSRWRDLIFDPIERRKLIFSCGALIAQQVNGIQWFYYFGTVFAKSIGLSDPFLMTLIVFCIQLVVVFVAVLTANKLPRRPTLLYTTGVMMVSIFVVGCLGIPDPEPSDTIGKVIITFIILEIAAFNLAWGPLGWTIASEMASGRNRNKIYAVAVACFWVTVWAIVFTLPYLYYDANLGPMTGFVYAGLSFVTLAYVWFCVGETTGRTMEEIEHFFAAGIQARKWKDQPVRSAEDDHMSVNYEKTDAEKQ